jgi:ornithine cyclodeaminase
MVAPRLLFDPLTAETLWLADHQVEELLDPSLAYRAVREALTCHARGDYQQPLKPYIRPRGREGEHQGGRFIAMPAFLGNPVYVAGIKWIAGFPGNVARGLPRASGLIVLNSLEVGLPYAVMECATVSARRTAAVAALSFDHLAPAGRKSVAVLGAGPIARSVIEALSAPERDIARFTVFDPNTARLAEFVASVSERVSIPVVGAANPRECVRHAQVIVTATTGAREYLEESWVAPGGLIVALSLDDCTADLFLSADRIIVDDFDQCNREEKLLHRLVQAGRFSRDQVYAELGEIVTGAKPGRTDPGQRIYVNPMGMAIEDLAVAAAVYNAAVARGVGQLLSR